MSDSEHHHPKEEALSWQPGARLKNLREEAGISLDTIIAATRIPGARLRALEEDAYDKMGTETFAIGYFRKYASYLGVASDPYVEQFKVVTGSTTPSSYGPGPESAANAPGSQRRSVFSGFRVWHLVIVVVVVWVLSVILLKRDGAESDLPGSALPTPLQEKPETGVTIAPSQATRTNVSGGTHEIEAEQELTPEPESFVSEEEISAEEFGEPVDTRVREAGGGYTEAAGADILIMTFTDECWVKVWDASGEVIFAHLQNSGDNLRLSGEAPFSVMLGNARAVDLLVNDRRVSTEPSAGRRTLRLNVGP